MRVIGAAAVAFSDFEFSAQATTPPLNYKKAKEGRREEGKQDRGGGECWGPGGTTFVTPLRYTNCSFGIRSGGGGGSQGMGTQPAYAVIHSGQLKNRNFRILFF